MIRVYFSNRVGFANGQKLFIYAMVKLHKGYTVWIAK